jgi:hypothetical protein
MLATIIDFDALWKILLAALFVGVGLTALFGEGIGALTRVRRHDGSASAVDGAMVGLTGPACVAALVVGVWAMTQK